MTSEEIPKNSNPIMAARISPSMMLLTDHAIVKNPKVKAVMIPNVDNHESLI